MQLAKWFALNTVTTFQSIVETYALCDDEETLAQLHSLGVPAIKSPFSGLNESVEFSLAWARNNSASYAFIVHSDLPLLSHNTINELLHHTGSNIVVVPDRWEVGTNLLGIPYPMNFKVMFGHDSFREHSITSFCDQAAEVFRSKTLGIDIDTIEDLYYVLKRYPRSEFSLFCHDILDHDTLSQIPIDNNIDV